MKSALRRALGGCLRREILAEAAGAQKGSREGNERGNKKLY